MPDFNIRSDSVNVEQIMEQIRARIREKRGVDYTEQQIRELAAVKLEKFLDPRGVRSDLLEQFRRTQQAAARLPNYAFEDSTLFDSHRAAVRWIRKLLNPILKLFFNPNPLIQALHIQAELNAQYAEQLTRHHQLYYEVMHNAVVELTKLGIETKNLKMRLESIASRLEFNERRARALESVVAYKPASERESIYDTAPPASAGIPPPIAPSAPGAPPHHTGAPGAPEGPGQRSRRRRRRRGRRGGGPAAAVMGSSTPQEAQGRPEGARGTTRPIPESDATASQPASNSHPAAAETVQQAIATEAHPTELPRESGGAPARPPATSSGADPGSDPHQQ